MLAIKILRTWKQNEKIHYIILKADGSTRHLWTSLDSELGKVLDAYQ